MQTPLKKERHSYAYDYAENYGQVVRIKRFTKKVKCKKKENFFLKIFRLALSLAFFGAFAYYAIPFNYSHYIEPMFVNRYLNKSIHYNASLYVNPTRNYIYNAIIGNQTVFSTFLDKTDINGAQHILVSTETKAHQLAPIFINGKIEGLEKQLKNINGEYPYLKPEIFIYDFASGKVANINGDKAMPVASMIKIPVLFELFRQIDENKNLNINNKIVFEELYKSSGSGNLQYGKSGYTTTLDEMARVMITNSDNSATNLILDYIGGQDAINRAFRNWGLTNSIMSNWLPDLEGTNKMSAKDLATILYNLDNPKFLSIKSREYIKEYMSHVKTDTLLPQGLENGSIIYHKTGDIGDFVGDAGVIYTKSGKKYVAVVIVKRAYNDIRARDYIQKVSRATYHYIEYSNKI